MLSLAAPNNTAQHETQRYLDVVRGIGIEVADDEPEVLVDSAGIAWVNNFVENQKLNDNRPIIGLNPGAATVYRRWNASNFATLGDRLHETYNAHIVITTGPREGELADQVVQQMSYSPIIVNHTTPMQLAASCSGAKLYISNDTDVQRCTQPSKPTVACSVAPNSPVVALGIHAGCRQRVRL